MLDVDLDDARPTREHERLRELLLADGAEHRRDRVTAVRVERAAEVGDGDPGEAAQHAVDELRGKRPAPRVAAGDTPPAGHVGAGVHGRHELRDVLGRVLEVAVHRHDDVAPRPREARVHGRMLAEVPAEANGPHAVVACVEALELGERAVGRPVVHEDDLVRPARCVERRDRAAVQLVERRRLVVERDDDRDIRPRILVRLVQRHTDLHSLRHGSRLYRRVSASSPCRRPWRLPGSATDSMA